MVTGIYKKSDRQLLLSGKHYPSITKTTILEISMAILAKLFIALVALIHCYIAWLEMFAWTSRGPGVFPDFPPGLFEQTTAMAANQGLYNAGAFTVSPRILVVQTIPALLAIVLLVIAAKKRESAGG